MKKVYTEPICLVLGLSVKPAAAPEAGEKALASVGCFEPLSMAQNHMGKLMRDNDGQIRIVESR